MKKEKHETGYKVLRFLLSSIFKAYYRPVIFNKENIPKEGPIIICGNHIHLFDQNFAVISTKRMIHYMSKKEHLEGKFGWFFKMAGCISVNREIHDENAKTEALEVLSNNQALGLFPEGTRNQAFGKKEVADKLYEKYKDRIEYKEFINTLKNNQVCTSEINFLNKLLEEKRITEEEYIKNAINSPIYIKELYDNKRITKEEYVSSFFLPLKFGAVSMASKTNASIVPVIITGKYTFKNNNLNARFGNPIKVTKEDNLEEKNNELLNEMIRLKLEGLDYIANKKSE